MKSTYKLLGSLLPLVFLGAGCSGDNSMTKSEIDSIKNSPKMTDADRQKVASGMAGGGAKAESQESLWAKAHPAEVAKINADRAKMGRPPLGDPGG